MDSDMTGSDCEVPQVPSPGVEEFGYMETTMPQTERQELQVQPDALVPNPVIGGIEEQKGLIDAEFDEFVDDTLAAHRPKNRRLVALWVQSDRVDFENENVLRAAKQKHMMRYEQLVNSATTTGSTSAGDRQLERITTLIRQLVLCREHLLTPPDDMSRFIGIFWNELKKHMMKSGFPEFELLKADFLRRRLWPKLRSVTERKFATGVGRLTQIDFLVMEADPAVLNQAMTNALSSSIPLPATDASYWEEYTKKIRNLR
ncbi:hypothetical protein QR680_000830 [Steinernema hermaphroditum]|uniref:Uncharacterized protein n=1 Tax=Steinernema hermaphroditum TaxID=289476 RepID=A0AA39GXK3_9BILA|nr:hypothetical protein QR680_000830 [Steinernema hermaphroditum]